MAATNDPGTIEKSMGTFAVERSMVMRAPNQENPFAGESQAIATGLEHYAGMCLRCHGAPGMKPGEFSKGLNPPAPMLEHASEEFSEGDLFWITKHGIRMTGMPAFGVTHNDDDIWKIVAFVNELPKLTDEQKAKLSEGQGKSHGHSESHHGDERASSDAGEQHEH